jgi:hypothetical protein
MPAKSFTIAQVGPNVIAHGFCTVTGEPYKVSVPWAQYEAWHNHGDLIQNAMPQLTDDQREFFITHMTPSEWSSVFSKEEY